MRRFLSLTLQIVLLTFAGSALAQSVSPAPSNPQSTQTTARPAPPTRDPHSRGFVAATELPDGAVPAANVDGNFILGPTHTPAPQMMIHAGVPQGTDHSVHDEFGRQQDLSRHRARAWHLRHARSHQSGQADRHHQPSRAVYAPRRRLRSDSSTFPAPSRPSSSARTAPTARCSPRSTT